jgi:hypothetical protein
MYIHVVLKVKSECWGWNSLSLPLFKFWYIKQGSLTSHLVKTVWLDFFFWGLKNEMRENKPKETWGNREWNIKITGGSTTSVLERKF